MGIGNDRRSRATASRKMRFVPLYVDPNLFLRLRDCAEAIGATRQDLIRITLDEKLSELENRLGRGEKIVVRRTIGELVPIAE